MNIKERIIDVFIQEHINYLELDSNNPPLHNLSKEKVLSKKNILNDLDYLIKDTLIICDKKKFSKPINIKNLPFKSYIEVNVDNLIEHIEISIDNNIFYLTTKNCNFPLSFLNKINNFTSYGIKTDRIIDKEIRNSYSKKCIINFETNSNLEEFITSKLENLLPKGKKQKLFWKNNQTYDCILYNKGGHFINHTDKKNNNNHYGTLLIIPPQIKNLEHNGGDLILSLNKDVIINSSENKEWKIIAFPLGIEHKINEIIEGNRLIFKTELLTENNNHYFPEESIIDNSLPVLLDMVEETD